MDIRSICYYETLAENERMNAFRALEFIMRRSRALGLATWWQLCHASITYWTEQTNIQRPFHFAHSTDLSPCGNRTFHALKRVTDAQVYPTIDLFWEAIDGKIIYGGAKGKHLAVQELPKGWDKCVKKNVLLSKAIIIKNHCSSKAVQL